MTDLPDPADWLETPLKDLSSLENALHCDICKEFFDTPMLTSCCHTFCSKCIRTCLSNGGKCPSCQASDQASKLRNNWILQTVVEQFIAARPAAIEVARDRAISDDIHKRKLGKRKRVLADSDDIVEEAQDARTTRSKSRRITASQTSEPEVVEIDSDGEFQPDNEPDDGLVECLFGCGKRVKPEQMDSHLNRCEQEKQEAQRAKSRTPVNNFISRPKPAQPASDRISELSYSLFNDKKLQQKLNSIGISSWGSRQLMIRRHTEWVNLWNANCDSGGKKSQRELVKELETWERTQGGKAPTANGLSSTIMRKDFDGAGWANTNKDDFSRLIADAKRKKNVPPADESETKTADAEQKSVSPHWQVDGSADQAPTERVPTLDTNHETPTAPYENNAEAISSIREKVDAANQDRHIEPTVNAGFAPVQRNGDSHPTTVGPPEHLRNAHTGSQNMYMGEGIVDSRMQSSPLKKMPMFEMPQQPVSDVDQGGAGR